MQVRLQAGTVFRLGLAVDPLDLPPTHPLGRNRRQARVRIARVRVTLVDPALCCAVPGIGEDAFDRRQAASAANRTGKRNAS